MEDGSPAAATADVGSREPSRLRAARGAVTVDSDDRDSLLGATEELLLAMLDRNGVAASDIVSIFFTATEDLRAAFPAEAARRIGLTRVPLLCAREMAVRGSLPSTVRVLMHFYTAREDADVEHVYLGRAQVLRDDL